MRGKAEESKNKVASGATYVLDASAVVDDDDIERGVLAAVPAPEEVPADAAEPVDRHLELRLRRRPPRPAAARADLRARTAAKRE